MSAAASPLPAGGPPSAAVPRRRRARGHRHWIARRVAQAVLVIFLVATLIFVATLVLPGDPARLMLGNEADQAQVEALRAQLELDEPVAERFASWLGNAVQGDFGQSYTSRRPVSDVIGQRVGNSLLLVLLTGIIAIPLSLVVGVSAALRRDGPLDHVVVGVGLIISALPEFVIGLALVLLFASTVLKVLPAVSVVSPGESMVEHLRELILPVATLVLATAPYLIRHVRASMIDVLDSEYVHMARIKGVSRRTITWRHALPNAIAPTIQASAFTLAWLVGGVVTVEFIFAYPGLGSLFVNAVASRDLPLVEGIALLFATVYVLLNLIADVLIVLIEPRLRTTAGVGRRG